MQHSQKITSKSVIQEIDNCKYLSWSAEELAQKTAVLQKGRDILSGIIEDLENWEEKSTYVNNLANVDNYLNILNTKGKPFDGRVEPKKAHKQEPDFIIKDEAKTTLKEAFFIGIIILMIASLIL